MRDNKCWLTLHRQLMQEYGMSRKLSRLAAHWLTFLQEQKIVVTQVTARGDRPHRTEIGSRLGSDDSGWSNCQRCLVRHLASETPTAASPRVFSVSPLDAQIFRIHPRYSNSSQSASCSLLDVSNPGYDQKKGGSEHSMNHKTR